MKQIVLLISIAFFFISCEKELNKVCNVTEPLKEIEWLISLSENEHITISKAIFKDKKNMKKIDGFIQHSSLTIFYNCSGEEICVEGGVVGAICEKYKVVKSEIILQN